MHRHARWWRVLLALATILAAPAVDPARAHARTPTPATAMPDDGDDSQRERRRLVKRAVRAARSRLGMPYVPGAAGPRGFDCSGLTQWSMRRAGVRLPRTSFAQARTGDRIARRKVRAGDLVFFSTAGPGASHVGIATGPSTVISATSHGVRVHELSGGYWGGYYAGARRVT